MAFNILRLNTVIKSNLSKLKSKECLDTRLHHRNIKLISSFLQQAQNNKVPLNCVGIQPKLKLNAALWQECRALQSLWISNWNLGNKAVVSSRSFHTSSNYFQDNKNWNDKDKDKDKKDDKDDQNYGAASLLFKSLALLVITSILFSYFVSFGVKPPDVIHFISWQEFLHHVLSKGEAKELILRPDAGLLTIVLHEGAIIKGKRVDAPLFMHVMDPDHFEDKLRAAEKKLGIRSEDGVQLVYERSSDLIGRLLASAILLFIALAMFSRGQMGGTQVVSDFMKGLTKVKVTRVNPHTGGRGVRFDDVAGLREAKQEVMEFVDYLKKPDAYRTLGAKVPKGALLLGPPGCGKTLLAKAVASEADVPFLSMNGTEFIEVVGGLGAARVRDLFDEARKSAPCIVYIDEIDAIGRKRYEQGSAGAGHSDEYDQTLIQLLVEMDGMAGREGVILLASTNRHEVLDKALLRPGRFDRQILIDLPVLDERREIFERHLRGISLEHPPNYYSQRMAHLTPGFSGADIANICNEAALHAARLKQKVVRGADLEYAVERVVGGTEKREHCISPEEKRVVAFHEAGHTLVGWMLPSTDALLKVTIVPRTKMVLGFAQYSHAEKFLHSKEELFDRMCMMLGGRVAESLTFNQISTGAEDDLKKITKIAYSQVRQFGMSTAVGLLSFPSDEDSQQIKGKRPYSKKLATLIDMEVQRLVAEAYLRTEGILKEHKDKLELLAENLLQKETLNHADVVGLLGPPPFGPKKLVEMVEFGPIGDNPESSESPAGEEKSPPTVEEQRSQST